MRHFILLVLLSACASTPAPRPASGASSTATTADRGSAAPTLFRYSLAESRPLPAGPAQTFTLGCHVSAFFGPFNLQQSGETLRIAATLQSANGSQVCQPFGEFVDGNNQNITTVTFNCAEGSAPVSTELSYQFTPSGEGNHANPVYLHLRRYEPESCTPVTLTLQHQ